MHRSALDHGTLPVPLDGAAERLQASIESYARGLLRGAEARASAITEHAALSAQRAAAGKTVEHAARMLAAIELAERRMTESFSALKEEAEALVSGLERSWPGAGAQLRAENPSGSEFDDSLAELFLD